MSKIQFNCCKKDQNYSKTFEDRFKNKYLIAQCQHCYKYFLFNTVNYDELEGKRAKQKILEYKNKIRLIKNPIVIYINNPDFRYYQRRKKYINKNIIEYQAECFLENNKPTGKTTLETVKKALII